MNYRVDFTKQFSLTVEADNEDQAVENAIKELSRPNSVDFDEDDVVNVEEVIE